MQIHAARCRPDPRSSALTPDDIERVAAKYFDTYRGAIVIVGDYAKVSEQVAPFVK